MTVSNAADHHANERMRCAADGERWPCEAFLLARRKADRRGSSTALIRVDPTPSSKKESGAASAAGRRGA